ncbi:MAG: hypothetical protein IPG50_09590 [Myxococcales bacterium]|nr:hypothetical protein [Myxococcales bacterium]
MRLWPAATSLLVLAPSLAACFLVVSPPEFGAQCSPTPATDECIACLAARCQPQLDRCCGERDCGGAILDIEACARSHDARSCGALRTRSVSSDADEAKLASCATTQCGGFCIERVGESLSDCRESRYGATTCSCSVGGATTELICTERTYPGTVCCSSPGWPGPSLSCQCRPLACAPTAEGCSCFLNEYATAGQAASCGGGAGLTCCAVDDACSCRPRPCAPNEREVERCSIADVDCAPPLLRVASCAVRKL